MVFKLLCRLEVVLRPVDASPAQETLPPRFILSFPHESSEAYCLVHTDVLFTIMAKHRSVPNSNVPLHTFNQSAKITRPVNPSALTVGFGYRA